MGRLLFLVLLTLTYSTANVRCLPALNNHKDAETEGKYSDLSPVERSIDKLLGGEDKGESKELMTENDGKQFPMQFSQGTGVEEQPVATSLATQGDELPYGDLWNELFDKYFRKDRGSKSPPREESVRDLKTASDCDWKHAFGKFTSGWVHGNVPGESELAEWENIFRELYGENSKRGCTQEANEPLNKRNKDWNDEGPDQKRSFADESSDSDYDVGKLDSSVHNSDAEFLRELYDEASEIKREGPTTFGTGWAHGHIVPQQQKHLVQWHKKYNELFGKRGEDKRGGRLFSSGWAHGNVPSKPKHISHWQQAFQEMFGKKLQSKRGDEFLPIDWSLSDASISNHAVNSRRMIEDVSRKQSGPWEANEMVEPRQDTAKRGEVFSSGWAHGHKNKGNGHVDEWKSMFKNLFGSRMRRRSSGSPQPDIPVMK